MLAVPQLASSAPNRLVRWPCGRGGPGPGLRLQRSAAGHRLGGGQRGAAAAGPGGLAEGHGDSGALRAYKKIFRAAKIMLF